MCCLFVFVLFVLFLVVYVWGVDGYQIVVMIVIVFIKGMLVEVCVVVLLGDMMLLQVVFWVDCVKGVLFSQYYIYFVFGKYVECVLLEILVCIVEMVDYVCCNDWQCQFGLDEDSCYKQIYYIDLVLQCSCYLFGFIGICFDDVVGVLCQVIFVLQGKFSMGQFNFKSLCEVLIVFVYLVGDVYQFLYVVGFYLDVQGQCVDFDKKGFDFVSFIVGGNSFYVVVVMLVMLVIFLVFVKVMFDDEFDGFVGVGYFGLIWLYSFWDGVFVKFNFECVNVVWLVEVCKIYSNWGDLVDWLVCWVIQILDQVGLVYDGLKFLVCQGSYWIVSLFSGYSVKLDVIKCQQLMLVGVRLVFVLKVVFVD